MCSAPFSLHVYQEPPCANHCSAWKARSWGAMLGQSQNPQLPSTERCGLLPLRSSGNLNDDLGKRTRQKSRCEERPLRTSPHPFPLQKPWASWPKRTQLKPHVGPPVQGVPAFPCCSQGADRPVKPSWTCQPCRQPSPLSAPETGEPLAKLCLLLLTSCEAE